MLPKPPDSFLKELDTLVYTFIWCNKPDKVNRKTIIGDYSDGGLRMMHIPSIIRGIKVAWVKRLLDDNNSKWKCFFIQQLQPFGGNLIWYCNINPSDSCLDKIDNSFINEVVKAWCNVVFETAVAETSVIKYSGITQLLELLIILFLNRIGMIKVLNILKIYFLRRVIFYPLDPFKKI
jgi:hypothetical protein